MPSNYTSLGTKDLWFIHQHLCSLAPSLYLSSLSSDLWYITFVTILFLGHFLNSKLFQQNCTGLCILLRPGKKNLVQNVLSYLQFCDTRTQPASATRQERKSHGTGLGRRTFELHDHRKESVDDENSLRYNIYQLDI